MKKTSKRLPEAFDTHVHSTFSRDGQSTLDEYARVLDTGEISGIGFAEHVDFLPECGSYGYFKPDIFAASIAKFKALGYAFHAGAEIDYAASAEREILAHLQRNPYEYTICSVHMIDGISVSDGKNLERYRSGQALSCMLERYYHEVRCSLDVAEFDVIGHINIYRRYLTGEYFYEESLARWMEMMDNELAKACAGSGKILEVNTSGLFSPSAQTVPDIRFLELYHAYGGRQVSLGSDAHSARHVARGFGTATALLKEIGFNYIILPWDRENPVKIS